MAALLDDYLARAASEQMWWGENDCCLHPANYVRELTGIDPAADWRGTYGNPAQARAIAEKAGGLVALFERGAEIVPAIRVDEPQDGDVGVVRGPVELGEGGRPIMGEVGAIYSGGMWVCKAVMGIRARRFPTVAAWRILI